MLEGVKMILQERYVTSTTDCIFQTKSLNSPYLFQKKKLFKISSNFTINIKLNQPAFPPCVINHQMASF